MTHTGSAEALNPMKQYTPAAIAALIILFVLFFGAEAVKAQGYVSELRPSSDPDVTELHVTPKPTRIVFEVAAESERPTFIPTSPANVTEGGTRDGHQIYVDGYRDGALYRSIHVDIAPAFSHIGNIVAARTTAFESPYIEGYSAPVSWAFIDDDDAPAWDAELRAMLATVSAAVDALQEEVSTLQAEATSLRSEAAQAEADRDAAVAARDAALAEVEPLRAEADALRTERAALQSEIEETKAILDELIQRLPPGLRNR